MRYLNGFIIIGLILVFISIAGVATGNKLLTEPGQPVNHYAWLLYLAAAALMLINGAVSIWNTKQNEPNTKEPARDAKPAAEASDTNETAEAAGERTKPAANG